MSGLAACEPLDAAVSREAETGLSVINVESPFYVSLSNILKSHEIKRQDEDLAMERDLPKYLPLFTHKKEFESFHNDDDREMFAAVSKLRAEKFFELVQDLPCLIQVISA